MVYQDLTGGYPLFRVLEHNCGVEWHAVPVDWEPFTIPEIGGLRFTAVPQRSEAPPYSPHRHAPHRGDTMQVISGPAIAKAAVLRLLMIQRRSSQP